MADKPQWAETRHSEILRQRKNILLPQVAQRLIKEQYLRTFSVTGERSIYHPYNTFSALQKEMYLNYGRRDMQSVMETLPKRIQSAVRQGNKFRIVDIGCDAFASLFTGLSSTSGSGTDLDNVRKSIKKIDIGLLDILKGWRFKAGKDFEMIGVHGGQFAIEEQEGLRLISTDMFDNIPIPAESIDIMTSFSTVYQNFGGFYLLELFDRLLKKPKAKAEAGIAVVWPFLGATDEALLTDEEGRILSLNTVFNNLDNPLAYFYRENHLSWTKKPNYDLTFPLKPVALTTKRLTYSRLIYQVEPKFLKSKVGKRIIPDEQGRSLNAVLAHADHVEYF